MGQNQATSLLTSAHSADDIRDFRKGQVFTPFDHKHNNSNPKTHQPTTSIDDDFAERMNLQGLERNTDSNSGGSKRNSFKIPSSSSNNNNNNRRRSQTTTAPTPTAATRSRMSCYYGSSPVQQQESILQQELQRKQQAQQEQEEQLQQKRTQRRKSFNIISRKNSNMF